MRSLTDGQILDIWDAGAEQHPLDRALTLLMFCGERRDELARLPIGARDARLFRLRAEVFGDRLEGYAECPVCSCAVEFGLTTRVLPLDNPPAPEDRFPGPGGISYRLPNSFDLAAGAVCLDADKARREILRRCVDAPSLPESDTLDAVSAEMAERDAAASIELRLACPECGHPWSALVDVSEFFWNELNVHAKRVLAEVHMLAREYGWTEREVLALSPMRRRRYLEMIAGE